MSLQEHISGRWFQHIHSNNLVYNASWEDPRLDRAALEISPDDSIVVITSAGCNVLDYALQRPRRIFAVDMNYRQNALLELKMAGIRNLDYATFFELFGRGRLADFNGVYGRTLRPLLSLPARRFWDDHRYFFTDEGRRRSFYFHGTTGYFAWLVNVYLNRRPALREGVNAILEAPSVDHQRTMYYDSLQGPFWNRFIRWAVGRDATLALLGVPSAQRRQVESNYHGGIARFIEDAIESVFASLPLGDNYFWRVYLTGEYTPECCPEYLKEENFNALKGGLLDAISIHTSTIQGFLGRHRGGITRFVLLDHMDWLAAHRQQALVDEWQAIVDRAAPGARVLFRSGGTRVEYVDPIEVTIRGKTRRVGELLAYDHDLAESLHGQDRVHTYGSMYVADLATA